MTMSRALLVTRPNHDATTDYLWHWTVPVVEVAKRKKILVLDLSGKKANGKNFRSYIASKSPSFLFINGHGNADTVAGQDNETLIGMASDTKMLIGLVIYVRSCTSAKSLGPYLVSRGIACFIGYKKEFIFFRDRSFSTRPLEDPIAKIFLEPSNLIPTTLLKGHTTRDADQRSQVAMRRNLRKLLSSNASFEERLSAPYLWSNIQAQVLLGDPTAVI